MTEWEELNEGTWRKGATLVYDVIDEPMTEERRQKMLAWFDRCFTKL